MWDIISGGTKSVRLEKEIDLFITFLRVWFLFAMDYKQKREVFQTYVSRYDYSRKY